jgi:fluoroquinolone transport system permease protein
MMKSRLFVLIKGELIRLHKYNVFSISILVAFIWGAILFFLEEDLLGSLLPFVLLIDATLMGVIYIGAVTHFEKTESTISTLLVTPIKNSELVLSKVLANILHNLFSASLIILVFIFLKDVEVNLFLIYLALISSTAFFTIGGLCLSYYQKDFTTMLVNIMIISFALLIPSALYLFGVLTADIWEYILLLNPIQAAQEIIMGAFANYEYTYQYYFSLAYMILGSALLYRFFALPRFQDYAVKQSGV